MLLINSILRACILLAANTFSLYVSLCFRDELKVLKKLAPVLETFVKKSLHHQACHRHNFNWKMNHATFLLSFVDFKDP